MRRRDFIRSGTLASLAIPGFFMSGCFRATSAVSEEAVSTEFIDDFDLAETTVDTLQQQMQEGKLTSRDLVEQYLKRIAEIDKAGPSLNSVIEVNSEALDIAAALDQERREGKIRGPLHGIPVLIKDNIDTADKMMTTAGSLALEGNYAKKDAFIVEQLRAAGAVLLGKTNLSEWANFRSTRSSSGWSSRGGQTRNPYLLDRNPCGSSSGSGSAVSANLCVISIGTETNGSIACPSSINGVVGIKPTVGLWSRTGIIPISHTQDTAGPMARTVKDAALLLGALTATDTADAASQASSGKALKDYTSFLTLDGLKGKRIGVEKSFLKGHEGVDELLSAALEALRKGGAEVVEIELLSRTRGISGAEFNVLQYEFKEGLNKYLQGSEAKVRSLADVIAFNKENEERVMPFFGQEILLSSQEKGGLDSTEYTEALKKILDTTRGAIDGVLAEHKLDAICGPTNGPSWCTDWVNGDSFSGYGMYSPAAIAGYPSIQVPMGLVHGLPVGLTFLASAFQEPALLSIAYAYEQISKKRARPQFKKGLS